jgi:hypothetical protein
MVQEYDFINSKYTVSLSPNTFFKRRGQSLVLILLDDSQCFFKFEGYPIEIVMGLHDKKNPLTIFTEIVKRDDLPREDFARDFNLFLNFLVKENLVLINSDQV